MAFTNAFTFFSSITSFLLVHLHMDSTELYACIAPPHTWESALLEQRTTTDVLFSLLELSSAAVEQLSLFCTVLFFLQNCLWQFVLILYYPGVLQAIK